MGPGCLHRPLVRLRACGDGLLCVRRKRTHLNRGTLC